MKPILLALSLWASIVQAGEWERNREAAYKTCRPITDVSKWTHCFVDALIPDSTVMVPHNGALHPAIINGVPVDPADKRWWTVVKIRVGNSGCTATVIGPRVLLTAAHCGRDGSTAVFSYKGENYSAVLTRSSLYPAQDHDISLGLIDKDFPETPSSVFDGDLVTNDEVTLLGYGCTQPGGGGGNDGVLRIGTTIVQTVPPQGSKHDVISKSEDGAALCYGDSGGPGFIKDKDGQWVVWGVNSKGNISDTNYNAYLRLPESVSFLQGYASAKGVDICGVTKDCGTPGPGPNEFELKNIAAELKVKDLGYHEPGYVKRTLEQAMLYLEKKVEIPPISSPRPLPSTEGR